MTVLRHPAFSDITVDLDDQDAVSSHIEAGWVVADNDAQAPQPEPQQPVQPQQVAPAPQFTQPASRPAPSGQVEDPSSLPATPNGEPAPAPDATQVPRPTPSSAPSTDTGLTNPDAASAAVNPDAADASVNPDAASA